MLVILIDWRLEMRTIKFRAWNTKHQYMYDSFFICASNGGAFDVPSYGYDTPNTEIEPVDDLVVMQFTGLTDINGVEIYEGDIVRLAFDDGVTDVFKVAYKTPSFRLEGFGIWSLASQSASTEVIGNIYKNPELLK